MKSLWIIIVLTFALGLESYAEKQPILSYGYYSVDEMKVFILSGTEKANQFKRMIFLKTGINDVNYIFKNIVVSRDTTLKAGTYRNSCWDTENQSIYPYLGKERNCPYGIAIYKVGSQRIALWIVDCANILDAPSTLRESDLPYQPTDGNKGKVYVIDTLHQQVYVYDTTIVNNFYYYGNGSSYCYYPNYNYSYGYYPWFSWGWSYYTRPYYFHNEHYYVRYEHRSGRYDYDYGDGRRVTSPGHTDPGGRVTPGGHDGRVTPPPHDGRRTNVGHNDSYSSNNSNRTRQTVNHSNNSNKSRQTATRSNNSNTNRSTASRTRNNSNTNRSTASRTRNNSNTNRSTVNYSNRTRQTAYRSNNSNRSRQTATRSNNPSRSYGSSPQRSSGGSMNRSSSSGGRR